MKIRQATMKDLSAITAVEAACFPSAEAASKTDFENRLQVYPNHFWVMEEKGKIIGFINGMVNSHSTISDILYSKASFHDEAGKWQMIFGLDVLPEYRQQGLAAQLIEQMIEQARKEGRKGLVLTCKDKLIHYYEKFGFKNRGISQSVHGGAIWYDMLLEFGQINLTRLGRFICYVLRHRPDAIGIKLDCHGWADVSELISGIRKKGYFINGGLLEEIVAQDNKQRYHYNEDKTKIRCAQGHSINVDVELDEKIPPEYLYHGTAIKNLSGIKENGICKMRRLYVHLSKDEPTAIKVGSRHGQPVVLVIDAKKMVEDGYKFYYSKNGVWLCDDIDFKYVVKIIDESNG
ncbi:GNAT family N-acetyltransferase [uncultured Thomasclavelia sp.]|uniref:GNAT family N-acetyltransferase n=1 Tax=uncultured Thomasclavelia sp. TaxID=3025759 RepID=UPI0025EE4B32|nr:GNAT family N-acetyltransferase [uncultured Thomasclavelia sp.]